MNTALKKRITGLASEIAPVVREHRCLALVVAIYAAAAFGLYWHFPAKYDVPLVLEGFGTSMLIGPIFAFCGYAIYVMLLVRPARLTRFLLSGMRQYLTRARLLHAFPVLLLLPIFASSFTIFKAAVPIIHPYAWDIRLAEWDLALHGGVHPWVWLQYAMGHPLVTATINFSYHLWFFIMYAVIYWLALSIKNPKLRMQFLLSFVFSWIFLGTVVATLFSSVGPCYYGYLFQGDDPYAPLMMYLHEANKQMPILALDVQKMLWDGYQDKTRVSALGISAMPSMHVATATLLALWGWRINRTVGIALTLFALVIMVGSVHLGWHYALDGYVGAAGAYVVWRVVGWMLSRSRQTLSAETVGTSPQVIYLSQQSYTHEH